MSRVRRNTNLIVGTTAKVSKLLIAQRNQPEGSASTRATFASSSTTRATLA